MLPPQQRRSALRSTGVAALVGLGFLCLCACSSVPDPTSVTVEIHAANNVNPDGNGQADPIVVRVYLLQKKDTFTSSEFNALYLSDKQVLASDIVSTQEFEVNPGKTVTFTTPDAQTANVVGVLAAYRDIANANWRTVVDIKPHEENAFIASLKLGAVSIEQKPDEGWFSWL